MSKIFPKWMRVVDVKSIELQEKDVIEIDNLDDFLWVCRIDACVWKLKDHYYFTTDSVVYIWKDGAVSSKVDEDEENEN